MYKVLLIKFNDVYSPVPFFFGQMSVLSPWTLMCAVLLSTAVFVRYHLRVVSGVGCAEQHGAD